METTSPAQLRAFLNTMQSEDALAVPEDVVSYFLQRAGVDTSTRSNLAQSNKDVRKNGNKGNGSNSNSTKKKNGNVNGDAKVKKESSSATKDGGKDGSEVKTEPNTTGTGVKSTPETGKRTGEEEPPTKKAKITQKGKADAEAHEAISTTGSSDMDREKQLLVRVVALATQKFLSDVTQDAMQYHNLRNKNSADKQTSDGSNGTNNKENKEHPTKTLRMEDLTASLVNYGVRVVKPDYFSSSTQP